MMSKYHGRLSMVAALTLATASTAPARAPVPPEVKLPPELALVPPDAAAVATARPRTVISQLPEAKKKELAENPEAWATAVITGCAHADLERVTVIFPPDPLPPVRDVKAKRPWVTPDPPSLFDVPPDVRAATYVFITRNPSKRLPWHLPNGGVMGWGHGKPVAATYRGKAIALDEHGWTAWFRADDRTTVVGSRASVEWVIDHLTGNGKPGLLGPALRAIRDSDVGFAARPALGPGWAKDRFPLHTRASRGEVLVGSLRDWLTRCEKEPKNAPEAVAVGVNVRENRLDLLAVFEDEKAAASGVGELAALRDVLDDRISQRLRTLLAPEVTESNRRDAKQLELIAAGLRALKAVPGGRLVSAALAVPAEHVFGELALHNYDFAPFFPSITTSVGSSDPEVSNVSFRERALVRAFEAYHAKHARYPDTAIRDKFGKPLLSWRVALLPCLGFEDLYKQFKLDEPWDSAHNKKLLDEIPWPYSDGESRRFRHRPVTRVYLPVGPGTMFEDGKGRRKADATDGADQTVLFLKTDRASPWTKPTDAVIDAGKPTIAGEPSRVVAFARVDGTPFPFEPLLLLTDKPLDIGSLLTRAGGEKRIDIETSIVPAVPSDLDFVEVMERMFKAAGIEIPENLPRPGKEGKP